MGSGTMFLNGMGQFKCGQEDFKGALEVFEEAKAIHMELGTLTTPIGAKLMENVAQTAGELGDQPKMLAAYAEAREIRAKTATMATSGGVAMMKRLAAARISAGDTAGAEEANAEVQRLRRIMLKAGEISGADAKTFLVNQGINVRGTPHGEKVGHLPDGAIVEASGAPDIDLKEGWTWVPIKWKPGSEAWLCLGKFCGPAPALVMYVVQNGGVNVRDGPNGQKLGRLTDGAIFETTGPSKIDPTDGTCWVPYDFEGKTGYSCIGKFVRIASAAESAGAAASG